MYGFRYTVCMALCMLYVCKLFVHCMCHGTLQDGVRHEGRCVCTVYGEGGVRVLASGRQTTAQIFIPAVQARRADHSMYTWMSFACCARLVGRTLASTRDTRPPSGPCPSKTPSSSDFVPPRSSRTVVASWFCFACPRASVPAWAGGCHTVGPYIMELV